MNRLGAEPSPYLRQHAENPVDWYPWGEEAFASARREDKPIFLSVGYSTCHWCHVMERESFEDPEIARILNASFVSIKVDREERSDVDRVYMAFVQAATGTGGWPMSVWLTPELKPFYGGTYFPPTSRWGRPGFVEVLTEIARLWTSERDAVLGSADALVQRLQTLHRPGRAVDAGTPPTREIAGPVAVEEGVGAFRRAFDPRHGGFGEAPKFPRASELLFLLRAHARTGDETARDMVLHTLRAMATGGMRDHVGGGFHRYSVDAEWRVPHFEKMLYDQAQLVLAYLEASQVSAGRDAGFYAGVAEHTLEYVRRDLTHPAGGFLSAEDADSIPPEHASDPDAHRTEGAFYLWTDAEVAGLFGDSADIVRYRFGIGQDGNAPHDPHGEFRNKNLLYLAREVDDVARLTGSTQDEVLGVLSGARAVLFEARRRRPRPHVDDKILTAWNGLMIAAFARAARVVPLLTAGRVSMSAIPARRSPFDGLATTGESGDSGRTVVEGGPRDDDAVRRAAEYLEVARRAADFIRSALWNSERRALLRRWRAGQASIEGFCEDYAFLIWGLVELFQADADPGWLQWALELQASQDEQFWDPLDGGWFSTTGRDPSVLLRLKDDYDGAEPAAGSVSVLNLLAISHLTGDQAAAEKAAQALRRYGARPGEVARVMPMMLCGLAAHHAGLQQIVIVGRPRAEDTRALLTVVANMYLPFALVLQVEPGERQARLAHVVPFVGTMAMRGGAATAYVCRNFACKEPVTDAQALRQFLA